MQPKGIMSGIYYNPPDDVLEGRVGRRLPPLTKVDHKSAMRELGVGEHLYVMMDRLMYRLVGCVDDESEFMQFYESYAIDQFRTFDLYALSEEEHQRSGQ